MAKERRRTPRPNVAGDKRAAAAETRPGSRRRRQAMQPSDVARAADWPKRPGPGSASRPAVVDRYGQWSCQACRRQAEAGRLQWRFLDAVPYPGPATQKAVAWKIIVTGTNGGDSESDSDFHREVAS